MEIKETGIGYICPYFPVKNSLAALSDGNKIVLEMSGSANDIMCMYSVITTSVAGMLIQNAKDELSTSEKVKEIADILARSSATSIDIAFRKAFGDKVDDIVLEGDDNE